jgi:hypothetical protein
MARHQVTNQPPPLANEHPPRLRTHDRYGHRIDEVEFHPAWHELMTAAAGHGLHAAPWQQPGPGRHLARAAGLYVWGQAEAGHLPFAATRLDGGGGRAYGTLPAGTAVSEIAARASSQA